MIRIGEHQGLGQTDFLKTLGIKTNGSTTTSSKEPGLLDTILNVANTGLQVFNTFQAGKDEKKRLEEEQKLLQMRLEAERNRLQQQALVSQFQQAPGAQPAPKKGPDLTTIALIGGGVVVLGGILLFAFKK